MKLIATEIEGLLIIEPTIFGDERGYFYESFRDDVLKEAGVKEDFVQDNQSYSHKGILRGLHYQENPYAQGKLVRVLQGAVLDVAVDIRKNSKTYGKHVSIRLDAEDKKMFYIPPGFAHGFLTLEDNTLFLYKCTKYYNKKSEGAIRWNSPSLHIPWGIDNPLLSEKDKEAPAFTDFVSPF
ncbi:MAG: dTDP-4-dehydrorhamnose 3,5-epimerase [Bacteroidetes bacterium]|jgi:dTDP-4-dehydrorhamnose 3,5-epimerase|nr:dTDP-4-dehydrorhamnose 3,5-epimerase [Bacteroidota bacterium]MDA8930005.1 dTDP-4-dehydrorhamnose 3,5-epimerase [Bacteroidia bacterium]